MNAGIIAGQMLVLFFMMLVRFIAFKASYSLTGRL